MTTKKLSVLLLVGIMTSTFGALAGAQENAAAPAVFAEAGALQVAQEWAALVSRADVAGLEGLLGENFVHIHATARVESKAEFLEAFKNGSRRYDPITIEDAKARVFGNAAVVTGKFNLKAFARGKTIEGVNRFTLVLVQTPDGPQVVSFQATSIPPSATVSR